MGVPMKKIRTLFISCRPFIFSTLIGLFAQDPLIFPDFISYKDLDKKNGKHDVEVFSDEALNEKAFNDLINEFILILPGKKILLTNSINKQYIASFISPQIDGIINKDSGTDILRRCILEVAEGNKYYCKKIEGILLKNGEKRIPDLIKKLTIREKEILFLIKEGMTSKEIAEKICISAKTVGRHKENIKSRLDLRHINDLYKI